MGGDIRSWGLKFTTLSEYMTSQPSRHYAKKKSFRIFKDIVMEPGITQG
jgi:hypothetical protein